MSENLGGESSRAALDLERRRIALKTAAELHDPRDLSALIATASKVYSWLSLSPRTVIRRADASAGERAWKSAEGGGAAPPP